MATRGSPRLRPSIERVGSAMSGAGAVGLDEEDDGETVDSVMNKLAIERRVQYGAEKMLDVIEKRGGAGEASEQEQVKERITAQLEAASERIRALEARLERLKGGTPSKPKRRPQPRLNGYASSSSLGLGSSLSSSTVLSSSSRPRFTRGGSNLTPDQDREAYISAPSNAGSTPSKRRERSHSAGEDSFDLGADAPTSTRDLGLGGGGGSGSSRMGWMPRSRSGLSSPGDIVDIAEEEGVAVLLLSAEDVVRQLRALVRSEAKGKGRDLDDSAGEGLMRLAGLLKKSDELRAVVGKDEVIRSVLPFLVDASSPGRRAAAYRVLRYVIDRESWGKMINSGVEWLIVRSFTRDIKCIHEREQALRLVRSVISLKPPPKLDHRPSSSRRNGHSRAASTSSPRRNPSTSRTTIGDLATKLLQRRVPLTDGIVRALVSVAENPDDPLRVVCLETLLEIGVLDIECLVLSDAFRTVLLAFKDGPTELGPSITGLLMHLVNQPSTRQFMLPRSDFETILVGLTEEYGKVPPRQYNRHVEQLQLCARNIAMVLGSWPGLIYLCLDDRRAVKSLVSSLYAPLAEVQETVLDLIFGSLRIKSSAWMNAFLDGKRLTVYKRLQEATSHLTEENQEDDPAQTLNLVDQYIALLLAVHIEAGLLEALVTLVEDTNSSLGRKATLLIGEVLQLANRLLPLQYAAKIQALPRLFNGAADFASPNERHVALSALSSIDSMNRNQNKAIKQARAQSGNVQDSLQRGQRQVQQVKIRLGLQIEDKQFQQMIVDSGVLLNRDHTKWNYEVIVELIEGPLLNPKRLDEAIKATKFVRRVFSFYHPYNMRFAGVKRTRPNHKWVRLACTVLSTMLANPEGIKYLTEDKLLRQMVECFNELDQYVGQPNAQPIFARSRVENTLTYGYFEMIGTLSKHPEGIKLLERFKFFTCFYHLSEQRSREDIMRIIIECFDYNIDAHPRIVLSKALTSAYMETRLFATHHLGRLLQENPNLTDWALGLMITQLYDTAMEVCEVAVMYLEEACSQGGHLEKVVALRPALEHLGEVGHPLVMRFVSTSIGFMYLHHAQYIEQELDNWLKERNLLYVIEVETFVTKTLRPFTTDTVEDYWTYDRLAPTHFFGELTKTPEGCQLLRERGIVAEFAEIVRLHGMESDDQGIMTNVKSVLWALGNIGSTEGGLPFLEDEEIIEGMVEIAEQSPVLTMRGTCFFVLGLLSSTRMGAEILEEYGWIATRTPLGRTTGLCLPNDISRFTKIEKWERPDTSGLYPPLPALQGTEGEIMTAIANLSNYVLAAGAMNNLKRIRNRQPRYFSSLSLFHRAARMISTNHYQAPVRRFILDLFDVQLSTDVLAQLVGLERESLRLVREQEESSRASTTEGDRGGRASRESRVETGKRANRAEHRKRAASSPGPIPRVRSDSGEGLGGMGQQGPEKIKGGFGTSPGGRMGMRNRGLTISRMEGQEGDVGRQRQRERDRERSNEREGEKEMGGFARGMIKGGFV